MSGGSMDYLYQKVEDVAFAPTTPLRRAFLAHLGKVAAALRAVEWVDSCDTSPGSEDESIRECLDGGAAVEQALADARTAQDELAAEIERAEATT